jgi:hypothetical protein
MQQQLLPAPLALVQQLDAQGQVLLGPARGSSTAYAYEPGDMELGSETGCMDAGGGVTRGGGGRWVGCTGGR